MFERLDEWRGRQPRDHPSAGLGDAGLTGTTPAGRGRSIGNGPSLEPFAPCPMCDGARVLHTEPVGTGTARLLLVCDGCGGRMDI